jgi:hypothetical protein
MMKQNPKRVTIVALIYRSSFYAYFFYRNLLKYTPELRNGQADFYFVANSAKLHVLVFLRLFRIRHYIFNPTRLSNQQHQKLGFAAPEYLGRVYSAYNFGVSKADTEFVVLLNSDMVMSPNWLPIMLKQGGRKIISPTLVERVHPKFGVFPGAKNQNFGSSFLNFNNSKWEKYCKEFVLSQVINAGGPYMPALMKKEWFTTFGGFPHGNLGGLANYEIVTAYGDQYFFDELKRNGIYHESLDSINCYHFKEGERETAIPIFFNNIIKPKIIEIKKRIIHRLYS